MRRIYDSSALRRDDEPFTPSPRDTDEYTPQAMRSVPSTTVSRYLFPSRVHNWAVSVSVSTPREVFAPEESVPIEITMRNRLPIPVTITTVSPLRWTWAVDEHREAAHIQLRDPPAEETSFTFSRGERKRFLRHWNQLFQVSERDWELADPGTHTIGAGINVDDPQAAGLWDETSIEIRASDA